MRLIGLVLAVSFVLAPIFAEAQAAKVPRIGFFIPALPLLLRISDRDVHRSRD